MAFFKLPEHRIAMFLNSEIYGPVCLCWWLFQRDSQFSTSLKEKCKYLHFNKV